MHHLKIDTKLLDVLINQVPNNDSDSQRQTVPKEIKQAVLERDRYCCRLCGSKKILTVHHINPKGNSDMQNLITLCRKCHYWVHIALNRKGYYFRVQDWGGLK